MDQEVLPASVLHWNYRGFTEFPIHRLTGEESEITDIYLKENLISRIPSEIGKLEHLESLYLSGNDISELPREISKLRCLKCLDVSGNRLRHIPDEIGEIAGLKFLILDENEITELPIRIAELRSLRYLSVCDNNLQWLPQRPVYNYHHCEFRFWRNPGLKAMPYSLWYHMFRDQQTRSLNIGCLSTSKYRQSLSNTQCQFKIKINLRGMCFDVNCPPRHSKILKNGISSPPSLFETCRRVFYRLISDAAKMLSSENFSMNANKTSQDYFKSNNSFTNLEDHFREFGIDSGNSDEMDLNGNNVTANTFGKYEFDCNNHCKRTRSKAHYYVPADIINNYFGFLPRVLRDDLCNGPISRCENVECKKPVFDYVYYEFCLGKIILIDSTEDIILSAIFCSKHCALVWRRNKTIFQWTL